MGPWYVTLYFNLDDKRSGSELRLHGTGNYYSALSNALDPRYCVAAIAQVGPFYNKRVACGFYREWQAQSRNKVRRLKRGITLWNHYKVKYNLRLWLQSKTPNEIREARPPINTKLTRKQRLAHILGHQTNLTQITNLEQIKNIKKLRVKSG